MRILLVLATVVVVSISEESTRKPFLWLDLYPSHWYQALGWGSFKVLDEILQIP